MARMDRQYLKTPFYGSRRMKAWLLGRSRPREKLTREEIAALDEATVPPVPPASRLDSPCNGPVPPRTSLTDPARRVLTRSQACGGVLAGKTLQPRSAFLVD